MVISHFARVQIVMAETGTGGFRVTRFNRAAEEGSCLHRETRVTTTGRIIRILCETCGHIGLRSYGGLHGPISRDRFARDADKSVDQIVDLTSSEFQIVIDDRSYRTQSVFAIQEIYSL